MRERQSLLLSHEVPVRPEQEQSTGLGGRVLTPFSKRESYSKKEDVSDKGQICEDEHAVKETDPSEQARQELEGEEPVQFQIAHQA